MPLIVGLQKKFAATRVFTLPSVSNFMKNAVYGSIMKRFKDYMNFTRENQYLIIAAVSNPRFKLEWIEDESNRSFCKQLFVEECEKMHTADIIQNKY